DGRFLALRDRLLNDTGAYVRTHGLVVPGMTAALLPGPYRWPAYRCEVSQVVMNKTPAGHVPRTRPLRGQLRARASDRHGSTPPRAGSRRAAPTESRRPRRDAVRKTEFTPTGTRRSTTAADYPLLLDKGLDRFGWEALRSW